MGQAKQKRLKIDNMTTGLSDEAKTVFFTANKLFDRVIKSRNVHGMCYHSTFFLYQYLKDKFNISTTPIIGYVNDGSDDVMISHAWLEYDGKKTDVSLGVTADHNICPVGDVIILDQIVHSGHKYSYHVTMTSAGLRYQTKALSGPHAEIARHKMDEHLVMQARAKVPASIRSYLEGAPAGLRYDELSTYLD